MFLRPTKYLSPEDRANLRPNVGDMVWFENQKYIVTQVGLKYVNMKHAETGAAGFAKITDVIKVLPKTDGEEDSGDFNFDFTRQRG